jgi:hypothetical protein
MIAAGLATLALPGPKTFAFGVKEMPPALPDRSADVVFRSEFAFESGFWNPWLDSLRSCWHNIQC